MKKSIFYYLFAVVCTVCLFTACSDDDDNDNKTVTVDNIVGAYPGKMDIKLAGAPIVNDMATSITVTKVSDSKVKISLAGFSIPNLLPNPVDIEVPCDVTSAGNELKLTGSASINILGADMPVTVTGDADGSELDLDIAVPSATVVVEFDGRKK